MIGQLTGNVVRRGDKFALIDVGGVAYRVNLSAGTLKSLPANGKPAKLLTHLAVRENALDLYGFLEERELNFFELLIAVSGIGPKSAITILSLASPATLEKAILAGDAGYLTKVSGIGRKSAEKIVLELKDRLGAVAAAGSDKLDSETEAIEALRTLGYSLPEAREALRRLPPTSASVGEKVKEALKYLGK